MKIDLYELISSQFPLRQYALALSKLGAVLMSIAFGLAVTPVVIFDVFFGLFGLNQGDRLPLLDREYLLWLVGLYGLMSGFWCLHQSIKISRPSWAWFWPLLISAGVLWFLF